MVGEATRPRDALGSAVGGADSGAEQRAEDRLVHQLWDALADGSETIGVDRFAAFVLGTHTPRGLSDGEAARLRKASLIAKSVRHVRVEVSDDDAELTFSPRLAPRSARSAQRLDGRDVFEHLYNNAQRQHERRHASTPRADGANVVAGTPE